MRRLDISLFHPPTPMQSTNFAWDVWMNIQIVKITIRVDIMIYLTHWGRVTQICNSKQNIIGSDNGVTQICISKLNIIGSDNGLSPGRRQAIIWTNAGILLIWPLGTNLGEMFMYFHTRKCTWKCRLRKGGHFVLASMCFKGTTYLRFFTLM